MAKATPQNEIACGTRLLKALTGLRTHVINLVRSARDGEVFGKVQPAYERYVLQRTISRHEMWTFRHQTRRVPRGKTLRLLTAARQPHTGRATTGKRLVVSTQNRVAYPTCIVSIFPCPIFPPERSSNGPSIGARKIAGKGATSELRLSENEFHFRSPQRGRRIQAGP
jgi:hypothetical protein